MRVLLINPGYQQNFWSFEGLLRRLGKKVAMPPLGLITLAALLPRSWEFRLVEEFARPLQAEDIAWSEVVMVTGMVTQYQGLLANLDRASRAGKLVVAGGPLAFHIPQDLLAAGAQVVVKGEVEPVVADLIQALDQRARGLIMEGQNKPGLRDLPVPRYDLLNLDDYMDMSIQFSRGCPFNCEFCDITLMFGRRVRCKSPGQVLAELQTLYDLGWRRNILVVDDNFIGDPKAAHQLLTSLVPWMRQRGYPFEFMTQVSLNLAREPDLMRLMVEAGFNRVFLGVETTDRASLAAAGKHQNLALDLDQACQAINRAGLMIMAACILGFDHEEPGAGRRFTQFVRRNRIPDVFATLLQAINGTGLFQRLQREGRMGPIDWEQGLGSQTCLSNFATTRPAAELAHELITLFADLYEPREYIERLADHLAAMPPLHPAQARRRPRLLEIRAVLGALLRLGFLLGQRRRFWRQVARGLRHFPSRMRQLWAGCLLLEHNLEYLGTIRRELLSKLAQ